MSKSVKNFGLFMLVMIAEYVFFNSTASAAAVTTFSGMATQITSQFEGVAKLITAGSYLAGIGFSLGAIMKFKAHKDNPTQIPIGTPIGLVFIAAVLLFFPTILTMTGLSVFGTTTTAGPTGTAWGVGG